MRLARLLAGFLFLVAGVALAPDFLGVPNFHQVDDHVYRGAQPAPYGFQSLANLGVRTVIDLRDESGQAAAEEKLVRAAGMRFVAIPMRGLGAPTDDQIARALAVLTDESAAPVFVHCRRGVDRTGTVIACYRIALDHWRSGPALDEARIRGMSFAERGMQQYILGFPGRATIIPAVTAPEVH